MKRMIMMICFSMLLFIGVINADADVIVKQGESYMCGDSFEIIFPDQPSTTSMISRDPYRYINLVEVHAEAGKRERLLQIRIKIRNLTPTVYQGLDPKSFKLTGFVRDRSLTYTPEIMEPYDYGNYEAYTSYSPDHNSWSYLPPLRMDDILLVYRVNPILVNWELSVRPQAAKGTSYSYAGVDYDPIDLAPCNAVFQFTTIRNAETGAVTTYTR